MLRANCSLVALLLASLVVLAGCEVKAARESHRGAPPASGEASTELAPMRALSRLASVESKTIVGGPVGLPAQGAAAAAAGVDRKIIYSAHVDLVVEDFSGVTDQVVALVKKFDGYVADSGLAGATGATRRGTWKIRVPVARFEEFVGAAKGLGELVSASTQSQDVSEEYYDVDARIRNKTKEEERLLKLLEEHPGKLEDVIAIERELSRVREELERMQGRLRVLADLTSLTTVELSITEIHGYEPPQAATLATRIRRAFDGSLATLRSAGEAALIAVVALLPWLAVLAVGLIGCYFFARTLLGWRRRRRLVHPTLG